MEINLNKIYIIILLIIGIYILNSDVENKTCIDDNYLELYLKRNKLNNKIYKSILKIDGDYYKDNKIKIVDYLKKEKPKKQLEIINNLIKILNNNRHHDIYNDYIINENTTLANVRNAWMQDNILNNLLCEIDKKKIETINNYFMSLVTASSLKLCTKDALINQCKELIQKNLAQDKVTEEEEEEEEEMTNKKVTKVIEAMTDFTKHNIDNNLIENLSNTNQFEFKVNSLEKVLKNVNTDSFGELEKPYLIKYINLFEKKYTKTFNFKKTIDIVKIVVLIIPDAINLAKEIKVLARSDPKKPPLVRKFIPLRSLFYKLKHFYKQLSYYNIVDAYIKDPEDREMAMLCCQSVQDKNKCFNFSKRSSNSVPIIMGFYKNEKESIGHVKMSKCRLPSDKELVEIQKKKIINVLNSNQNFKNLSNDTKKKYFEQMRIFFNYYRIKISDESNLIGDIVKKVSPKIKRGIKKNYVKIPALKKNNVSEIFNHNSKYVNKIIKKINKENNLDKLENIMKLIKSDFDFRSLDNMDRIKQSMVYLVKLNHIFTNLGLVNEEANKLIKEIFVYKKNYTFESLFNEYLIGNRFHKIIIKSILDMLKEDKDVEYKSVVTPKSAISSIKFKNMILPVMSELNLCNSWKDILEVHRRKRTLSPKNYLVLKNKIISFCNNKNKDLDKATLKKDDNVTKKIVKEVIVKDVNNKDQKILVKEDNNKKIIVKKVEGKYVDTNKILLNNNQILINKNKNLKNDIVKNPTILIDNAKGVKVKLPIINSKIKISQGKVIDKVIDKVELGIYLVEVSVTDTSNNNQKLNLYLRREKEFDQYIFLDQSKESSYIPKYSMDQQMKFYMYNKPYNKKIVKLLNKNNKMVEIELKDRILKDLKILKKDLVKNYKKFDEKISNILRNKLYHFFGNI